MKASKIVTGIISILVGCFMLRQANLIYNLAKFVGRNSSTAAIPLVGAILIIAGGIVSLATCKTGYSKGAMIVYFFATIISFVSYTRMAGYKDLIIYSIWSLAMTVYCFAITHSTLNQEEAEEEREHQKRMEEIENKTDQNK